MARSNNLIPNFTGGEISPRSSARRDLEGYYNSTEYQVNFISDLQGGARFRPGSRLQVEATGTRLIPFVYDALDNYFIEVGKWVRVLTSTGSPKIKGPATSNTWTVQRVEKRTNEVVFHVLGPGYANLLTTALYSLSSVSPELDDDFKAFAEAWLDDTRISSIATSSINGAWREVVVESVGTVAASAVTPDNLMVLGRHEAFLANYTAEEAQRLQFTQRFDEMWMTVGTKPAKKLTRLGTTGIPFTFDNAFIKRRDEPDTNITFGAITGTGVTVTASGSTFVADDVGAYIATEGEGLAVITGYTSATEVDVDIISDLSGTFFSGSTSIFPSEWIFSFDQLTTADNYPYCVALYENRLIYAHTDTNPSRVWGSEIGLFESFNPPSTPVADDDAFIFDANFEGSDINFMLPDKDLLYLGCLDLALGLDSGSPQAPIAQNSFRFRRLHTVGTALGRPYFNYESDLYFVDRGGTGLWRVQYNFNTDKFEPEMITIASDNLVKPGIKYAAIKNGDDARIFLNLNNGASLVNTISRIYGTQAFARLETGLSNTKEVQYAITNICNLPSASAQDTVGGIMTDPSGRSVVFTFGPELTSASRSKDEFRANFAANEIEAKENYNGYAYFRSQFAEYLDLRTFSVLVGSTNLTFSATTGTGVTVTASGSQFAATDVGRRILILTNPSFSVNTGAGIALITAFSSATQVTVTIEQDLNGTTIPAGGWYVSQASGTTFNLPSFFYAGKKVDMVIDGVLYPNISVGNDLTVESPADGYIFQVGFKYPGILKTVNMQGIGQLGTSEGLKKNLHKMRVNFFETGQGTSYGTDFYRLENLDFSQLDDPTDRPPPLFSGEKEIRFDENWEEEKHIYIRHEGGTPCTVLSLIPFFNTSMD